MVTYVDLPKLGGQTLYVSPQIEQMLGHPVQAWLDDPYFLFQVLHPDDREWMLNARSHRSDDHDTTLVFRVVSRAGRIFTVQSERVIVRDEAGAPKRVLGFWIDISERVRLERDLHQKQKMEAIGRLAGGIAHDFNNLLLVIRGYSAALLDRIADAELAEMVEQIDSAAQRAAEFTHQLLAFSRQQVLRPELSDLNLVVEETLRLLERTLGESVIVATELEPSLPAVSVDRSQVTQAVLNLAINARDAMPNGGRLLIRTTEVELDEAYAASHDGVLPGRYALLEVVDSGTGMNEETKRRAFDPFFTTKDEGSGLGLATVYGLVEQSGGHISLLSELGRGTSFRLYFPATCGEIQPRREPDEVGSVEGHETVLLVEDTSEVRALVAATLAEHGYTVLAAADGHEALALAERNAGTIDLLLTDVVMPGMSGGELADRLTASNPRLEVLFMSGYPSDTVVRHGIAEAKAEFIEKPYLPAELALKVRECLNRATGR